MSPLEQQFAASGPLARSATGFRHRPGQLALAQAIARTIETRGHLVAEAGTGVGKTFAYLVPLLMSQGRAIVSTATRHLQDQLFNRDLPQVKAALGVSADVAVLKGRSNYLCLYRLEEHRSSGRFQRREDIHTLAEIARFAATTHTGDITECGSVPESSPVWAMATSTRENCLGQDCPRISECHVAAARKRAAEADLVVVNHHLLCADMALREEGFAELLPNADHIVIDEAHALADIATQFFGQSVSTQTLGLLARDTLACALAHARDGASWADLCGAVERATAEVRLLMPAEASRLAWDTLDAGQRTAWRMRLDDAIVALGHLQDALQVNAERHPELAQLHERCQDVASRLRGFCADPDDAPVVRWMERSRHALTLHVTPYDIRERFRAEIDRQPRSWILLSATLAVSGPAPRGTAVMPSAGSTGSGTVSDAEERRSDPAFAHFLGRIGMEDATTMTAESPFDFQHQGMLLVPDPCPDPKSPDLIVRLLETPGIGRLIDDLRGGCFILCTSLRAVENARRWLLTWAAAHPERLLLIQGESPRHQLIDTFRQHGRAILVGSHSFWEGVDVPGNALSMVLIDKLPFAPPDDPVLEARSRWMQRQGRDPFMEIQLPQAAILLKQGVGRLIRTESDHGLVVIGDRRLADTAYGRRIVRSLPDFARTRDADTARRWMLEVPTQPADQPALSAGKG
jgi:ATP-dependent DNA helicase DinG